MDASEVSNLSGDERLFRGRWLAGISARHFGCDPGCFVCAGQLAGEFLRRGILDCRQLGLKIGRRRRSRRALGFGFTRHGGRCLSGLVGLLANRQPPETDEQRIKAAQFRRVCFSFRRRHCCRFRRCDRWRLRLICCGRRRLGNCLGGFHERRKRLLCCRCDGRRLNLSVLLRLSIGDGGSSHRCGRRRDTQLRRRRLDLKLRRFQRPDLYLRATAASDAASVSAGVASSSCATAAATPATATPAAAAEATSPTPASAVSGAAFVSASVAVSSLCAATTATPATTAPATAAVAAAPRPALAGSADACVSTSAADGGASSLAAATVAAAAAPTTIGSTGTGAASGGTMRGLLSTSRAPRSAAYRLDRGDWRLLSGCGQVRVDAC